MQSIYIICFLKTTIVFHELNVANAGQLCEKKLEKNPRTNIRIPCGWMVSLYLKRT